MADHPELLATACAAYADWKAEAPDIQPAIELDLALAGTSAADVSCGIHVEGSRLTLTGDGISGEADAGSKRARCSVPPRLLGDAVALAAEVTDTLLLFLLARSGRTPIHAAGVVVGGRALLLAGPSGSGKSTLALASARQGLAVLSDDTVYAQLEPALRVWGFPRPIHVFPEDAPAGKHALRLRGGKRKAAVPLPSSAHSADRPVVVLLGRGEALNLVAIDAEAGQAGLARLEPGFDLLAEASATAARALTADGAWRLTLTRDPDAAVALLCARFA